MPGENSHGVNVDQEVFDAVFGRDGLRVQVEEIRSNVKRALEIATDTNGMVNGLLPKVDSAYRHVEDGDRHVDRRAELAIAAAAAGTRSEKKNARREWLSRLGVEKGLTLLLALLLFIVEGMNNARVSTLEEVIRKLH